MAARVRIAVIGVGYMGERHAQKVSLLADLMGDVELVGVADIDHRRASRMAVELGTRGAPDARALPPDADASDVDLIVGPPGRARNEGCYKKSPGSGSQKASARES